MRAINLEFRWLNHQFQGVFFCSGLNLVRATNKGCSGKVGVLPLRDANHTLMRDPNCGEIMNLLTGVAPVSLDFLCDRGPYGSFCGLPGQPHRVCAICPTRSARCGGLRRTGGWCRLAKICTPETAL
jgi:hypothetical protein